MKYVDYKIVEDRDLPALIIKDTGDGGIEIVLNTYHKDWLALNRNTIPGIVNSLTEKLQEIANSILEERYTMDKWNNDEN